MDGNTTSINVFSWSCWEILVKVTNSKVRDSIPKLNLEIELIELREEVIKSLSHNQKYLYNITCAIKSGFFSEDMKDKVIDVHDHTG